ncbi:MAG TPA: GNAT family N-acetyltransferase [Candidatus Limnocylindrales bacterium]|nr:GNAT family N-acetyltransferase [Candidatus Limnocylindrales bacterium]
MEGPATEPILRLARLDEAEAIDALMKLATRDIFPLVYNAEQTASATRYVAVVDRQLIEDWTYYVFEAAGQLIACGGWSKRAKLYTGSGDAEGDDRLIDPATEAAHVRAMYTRPDWTRRGLGRRILEACEAAAKADGFRMLTLGATLPGVALYSAFGFRETGREDVRMPDGVALECVWMDKPIA